MNSHSHCWEQETPACGIKKEHHSRCCLCEDKRPMTTTMRERFRAIGEGSVRFMATRQEVLDFIEQELKKEREEIVEMIKSFSQKTELNKFRPIIQEFQADCIINTIKNRV